MSRLPVFTEAPVGGDRVYLDVVGNVEAVRFSTSVNGDLTASWQMQLDPKRNHRAIAPGRLVRIPYGASKGWSGFLNNPARGDVWSLNATGSPADAKSYSAIPSGADAYNLDDVIDAAITRGLPWSRPAALPSLAGDGSQPSGFQKVADVLNTVCDSKGKIWNVNRAGQVTAAPRSTSTAYLLMANDTAGGRTVIGFVTDVHVTYLNAATYTVATTLRSVAARPYGRFEDVLDLTAMGPISTARAQDHGDHYLDRRGPRLRFTKAFSVAAGQLRSPGGAPVDLATVQASDGRIRVLLTDPDSAAGELALGAVMVPMGETDYDVDADVLTITPLDSTPTGLSAVFS